MKKKLKGKRKSGGVGRDEEKLERDVEYLGQGQVCSVIRKPKEILCSNPYVPILLDKHPVHFVVSRVTSIRIWWLT
ncbi:hypothetical protein V1478_006999 [Vespula squamosa]|uniref:Uncharacterized protein n=1 Tax=Vespula squamosa TaxID=30214 RepID=A0ABD2B1Z5_VESSQ